MLPMIKATYRARACGAASISEPSSNGNRSIAVPVEVTQGESIGEHITWISVFHETVDRNGLTGTDRIIESLQFMGWKGDDISELVEADDERARALLPDEVDIVCEPDTFDGETRLKVRWVNKAGGGRFAFKEPLKGNDLKSFASQLRGSVRNAQSASGRRPAPNGKPTESHPNAPAGKKYGDEDIPF